MRCLAQTRLACEGAPFAAWQICRYFRPWPAEYTLNIRIRLMPLRPRNVNRGWLNSEKGCGHAAKA